MSLIIFVISSFWTTEKCIVVLFSFWLFISTSLLAIFDVESLRYNIMTIINVIAKTTHVTITMKTINIILVVEVWQKVDFSLNN